MMNERAQIIMRVTRSRAGRPRRRHRALQRLEGVGKVSIDLVSGIVRVDGAATDYELVGAIEGVGKRAQVVTHRAAWHQGAAGAELAGVPEDAALLQAAAATGRLLRPMSAHN